MARSFMQHKKARALGWAGIGLGLAELAAPGWLGKKLGLPNGKMFLRALGMREVLSGVGVVAPDDPSAGLWTRVAGDVIDLAALGAAARTSTRKKMVFAAIAAVA